METPRLRRLQHDGVRGRAAGSGAAGGRWPRPAGRGWVSISGADAAVDGREIAAEPLVVGAAGTPSRPGGAGAAVADR